MKVCDLTQSYAPTGGGVRTYIHAKRDYLRAGGEHEHLLIVPGPEDTVTREEGATTYTVASPLVPGSKVYRLLLRSDKVLGILRREAPDVVEVHCAYNLPWTAIHYRKGRRAAVVGCYMTDVPTAYVEPAVGRLAGGRVAGAARRGAERYARALYSRCDATLAISPALGERLREMGVENVRTIPLGVDLEVFHPGRRDEALRAEFGASPETLLCVYAGRLDGEKRAALLVEAFERLPEGFPARLVLVGEGPLRGELTERGARTRRVTVLPFRSDRVELATLLASADVYTSMMPYETFGLSVIEAQACGLPVLGVRGGAMVDRVPDGVGVLGRVDSVDDVVRALGEVSREEWREMGRRARALVEAELSWERTFERVLSLYRDVLETRAGAPAEASAAG